jgi:hypothetical protein
VSHVDCRGSAFCNSAICKTKTDKITRTAQKRSSPALTHRGRLFEPLLDFLRTGVIVLPRGVDMAMLAAEAEFYLIDVGVDMTPSGESAADEPSLLAATRTCSLGDVILLFRRQQLSPTAPPLLTLRHGDRVTDVASYSEARMASALATLGRRGWTLRTANAPMPFAGGHVPFAWLQLEH